MLALMLSAATACHNRATDGALPRIDSVRPPSVSLSQGEVAEVVIAGRGFSPGAPGTNTIEFAGMTIGRVPANAEGTEIRFVVPGAVTSNGEAPPRAIQAGEYPVRITTAAGVSNSMTIRIIR
jgi:hypothetical protein